MYGSNPAALPQLLHAFLLKDFLDLKLVYEEKSCTTLTV